MNFKEHYFRNASIIKKQTTLITENGEFLFIFKVYGYRHDFILFVFIQINYPK